MPARKATHATKVALVMNITTKATLAMNAIMKVMPVMKAMTKGQGALHCSTFLPSSLEPYHIILKTRFITTVTGNDIDIHLHIFLSLYLYIIGYTLLKADPFYNFDNVTEAFVTLCANS